VEDSAKTHLQGDDSLQAKKKAARIRGFLLKGFDSTLVVLSVIDVTALMIFFAIELVLLSLGQVTVVGLHISLFLVLNPGFALFQARRFAGCQLAIFDPVGNSVLLAFFAAIDLVDPRMSRINHARAGAGGWSCGLSRGGPNTDQTANCQD
jgi:hypothetical protein